MPCVYHTLMKIMSKSKIITASKPLFYLLKRVAICPQAEKIITIHLT